MQQLELIYFSAVRFILPALAVLMLIISVKTVLHHLKRKTLARFAIENYENVVEIKSAECMIGRSILCDVRLKNPTVQKEHAVLTLTDDGFKLTPASRQAEVFVNNYKVDDEAYLQSGDRIRIGGSTLQIAVNPAINMKASYKADHAQKQCRACNAVLLTLFQLLTVICYILHSPKTALTTMAVFGAFMALEWIYLPIRGFKSNVGVEIMAFFLTTVGLCVSASKSSELLIKQGVFFAAGLLAFIFMGLLLSHLNAVDKLRIPVMVLALLLFFYNCFFGTVVYGAKNWVSVFGFLFQPSEFIKVALVFVSASALDKMLKMKNLITFLGFVFICLLCLAYIRDFGAAAIYFAAMMVILCLRLCDLKIVLGLGGAALAGCLFIIRFIPYITDRFATYLHAWDYASSGGYQQTQTMMSIASGGLFGLGPGNGNLNRVFAADTDLVFGVISEEFGLLFSLCVVLCFVLYVVYASVSIPRTRSIYYAVTASAASAIFLFQTTLNLFGSVDLLPLTGVTMPFVSNGGSSMIAAWMLLAFIKLGGSQYVVLRSKEAS